MNSSLHEQVAQRAHQNWQRYGSPAERDTEIWLEAERQLAAAWSDVNEDSWARESSRTLREPEGTIGVIERIKSETAAESIVEYRISPAISDDEAINAALQKPEVRAPKFSQHPGPKA